MTAAHRLAAFGLAALTAASGFFAVPAAADEVDSAVAAARGAGLPVSAAPERVANSSAAAQAAAGGIFHADISGLTSSCTAAAEIVGRGPSVSAIFSAFRESPGHWSKLSDPSWTSMGTGLASGGDGNLYVSVVFCRGGAALPAPATAAAPRSRPSPSPRRAGAPEPPPPPPPPPPPVPVDVEMAPAPFLPVETWQTPLGPSVS